MTHPTFDWRTRLDEALATYPPSDKRRPIIGITGNFGAKGCELAEGYYASVLHAGGIPVVIPPFEEVASLDTLLDRLDGILLSGGADLNPLYLGEEPLPGLHDICPQRDEAELRLIRMAFHRQIPMLGICRGIQMMVAALDGTIYQDLKTQCKNQPLVKHSQELSREYASHTVWIDDNSLLRGLIQAGTLAVNSFHHQAVRDAGPHLKVVAQSADGVVEAVESKEHKSLLGVQWHPECFILRGDESMLPLFRWLTDEALNYREAREVHRRILTLDSHCDTPMFFTPNDVENAQMFRSRSQRVLVDLHKMSEGGLDASIMIAYLPQGERTTEANAQATKTADLILSQLEAMVEANSNYAGIARTPDDLYRLKAEGKKAVMMGIENGYAIGHDLSLVEHFRRRGVVYMTLCHNGDNDICDSARGNAEHGGLSPFGREVVGEMNRLGMMVDLSHAGEKSFYDALEVSKQPIVCSHSNARVLCDHPRNLTDDQMRALARAGGVAQVTLYNGFLRTDGEASILDAMAHLKHMAHVMGVEHVGIGTDFDGDGGVPGVASASELINFTRRLLREQFSEADLRLIWGENFLRVMRQVQAVHEAPEKTTRRSG